VHRRTRRALKGRGLNVIWLLLVVGVLVLFGQTLGMYDVPIHRDLRVLLPFGQAVQPTAEPTPATPSLNVAARPVAAASPAPASVAACTAAAPRFVHGTAVLKAALGASMGEAMECERVVDAAGSTEQKTSTGLAYYRARSNISTFTNGWDHWAVTPAGVVHWTGDDLEPPPGAEPLR
jgi:hypothetical protein